MTEPQMSGADLARVALMAARKNAKTAPANPKAARKKRTAARRGDGRDPITLGSAVGRLVEDRAWEAPAVGGSIMDQWATLCPELVGEVQPIRYDPDRGHLELRPATDTRGAQLRLLGPQLAKRINDKLGKPAVRTIRVLPTGPVSGSRAAALEEPASAPTVSAAPRTRADAPPGYHQALQAARTARQAPPDDPTAPARDRLFGTIRDTLREPETAFTDALAARETAAASSGGNDPDAVRQAAIQRARDQKAGRAPAIRTAFQRTA